MEGTAREYPATQLTHHFAWNGKGYVLESTEAARPDFEHHAIFVGEVEISPHHWNVLRRGEAIDPFFWHATLLQTRTCARCLLALSDVAAGRVEPGQPRTPCHGSLG